jgi:hypothetical protein
MIKVLVAAGATAPEAIRIALGRTFADFAHDHTFHRPAVSQCINGVFRHDRIRAALTMELGVEREWLDALLDAEMERRRAEDAGRAEEQVA